MAEPLTAYERKTWRESAKNILAYPERDANRTVSFETLAKNRLRYEATIQAVEAQRDALVTAGLDLVTDLSDWIIDKTRPCWGHTNANVLRIKREALKAAIKEATDGA